MDNKKILYWVGTIILFLGLMLAFLPHATHARLGFGEEIDHKYHIISGIILVVIALSILIKSQGARLSLK